MALKEAQFAQSLSSSLNHLIFPPPNSCIFHTDTFEIILARLLESVDTVLPVVLEVCQGCVHWVGAADTTQTPQGEVVVEDEGFLRVVEALHILTRLGVVGTSVHMLHHVQVGGDVWEMLWLMEIKHLIHEVDIPEVPAGSCLILHLQGGGDHLLHHVCPVGVLDGHDHLIYVQKGNVLVSEEEKIKFTAPTEHPNLYMFLYKQSL